MAGKIRTGIRSFQVTNNRTGGTKAYDVKGTATVEVSGDERTTLESANNPAPGAGTKSTRGRFELELLDAGDLSLVEIQSWEDITAVLVGANRKTYGLEGWQVEKPSLDTIEGGVSIALEGVVTEQTYQ